MNNVRVRKFLHVHKSSLWAMVSIPDGERVVKMGNTRWIHDHMQRLGYFAVFEVASCAFASGRIQALRMTVRLSNDNGVRKYPWKQKKLCIYDEARFY